MAIKVKLRQKAITGSRQSLYLDFYPAIPHPVTGAPTRREFLNLYLFDVAKDANTKLHNKETLQRAEFIRQQKDNEVNKPEIYTGHEKEQLRIKGLGEVSFIEYFQKLASKRAGTSKEGWASALKYLEAFTGGNLKFADLNERFCNNFKEYLLTEKSARSNKVRIANNSASVYFSKFKAALRQAYKDGFLQTDLNAKVDPIKFEETRRSFLTLDEVNTLIQTECDNQVIKRAAIFSVFTGLRFSDIQKLKWGEVVKVDGEGYFINFKQQKTKGVETLPISEDAFNLLGERRGENDQVFEGLYYSAYHNQHLAKWLGLAGITRNVTFHAFRHTFATLQISLGTDIYTVSKLLGHRDLKTTQIYAKIIDQTKRTAANRIQLNITGWK